ncbi:MAG: MBL fold metallo-hydrolase [Nitrospina sp.]|nr:MAG: MBL fold metallo-hydrolase [Nitrospina sp.]
MIRTTLIGHACLLIQSKETTILTDPVWFDYLWEEINTLCPSIVLEKDKIPPVDVLNLSHRHQDHFDVHTLAYLKRNDRILKPDVTILAPQDDILLDILKELEFENVHVVSDFEPIQIKDVTITATPSRNQASTSQDYFPEHGLLVNDGEVTLWNQVDTIVDPDIVEHICSLYGQVDMAHGRFVPLLEGNFAYNKPFVLPFNEYCSFLNVMKALNPKFVVPGSAAFRYRDEFNYLNAYTFPTTQEQYLRDLKAFCPEMAASMFLSGDVAHIETSGVRIEKQSSNFVRVREDDSQKVIFKPVMEVAPIRTQTSDPKQVEQEFIAIRDFVENQLLDRLKKADMWNGWKEWQVCYQLEVFGQEKEPEVWSIDFGLPEPEVQKGDLGKINVFEAIASSELHALIEKRTSWDYVALCGNYRTFNNIYRVTEGNFEYYSSEKLNQVVEPLMEAFPATLEMDREKFMKDVRRWKNKA